MSMLTWGFVRTLSSNVAWLAFAEPGRLFFFKFRVFVVPVTVSSACFIACAHVFEP